jgi:U32 family peptidase
MPIPPSATKPELLAPAGDWECVRAAVANGADAIYFGLSRFNARLRADNFTEADLPKLIDFLHQRGVKAYVTFNVLVFTDELDEAQRYLITLAKAGVDAVLIQDVGLAALARDVVPDLSIHASTQMTLTSPEGVAFAKRLGLNRVVLARELSIRELEKFDDADAPQLEVFVHGALCVAYSGQCLTSEALGQRSANRGECAQACRLPYELLVDGALKDLGDRRYLLSPQDLAAIGEIPELIRLGIASFKIEGRLKAPEYVAAVTNVYRKAIDAAWAAQVAAPSTEPLPEVPASAEDRYKLEMVFSRGLYKGWIRGVNHQELVHGRYGKKRGAFVGFIRYIGRDFVECEPQTPVKPGDGLVFDTGGDTDEEQGGRVYEIRGQKCFFQYGKIDFSRLRVGDRIWKTDDPQLDKELRRSFEGEIAVPRKTVNFTVSGAAGQKMQVRAELLGLFAVLESEMPLDVARKQPLTIEKLRDQFGRLGETGFELGELRNNLAAGVILPVSELNRLRRELVAALESKLAAQKTGALKVPTTRPLLERRLVEIAAQRKAPAAGEPEIAVLCRTLEQIEAAHSCGLRRFYADFEDVRRYKDAVALVRKLGAEAKLSLATPRIQKAGEQGFFQLIESYAPDGVLVRNLGAIDYFRNSPLPRLGDFSLNVSNPLSAALLMREGLQRMTVSYDLNANQVLSLLRAAPPEWFEITLHQHIPMFHMEHCVFAAFLSKGTDYTNCGRPCEEHKLELLDRIGMRHPVKADVGCRNTVYNGQAQSGASYLREFLDAGARAFRIEFLNESPDDAVRVLTAYQDLFSGSIDAATLVSRIKVLNQLGVTKGTLAVE